MRQWAKSIALMARANPFAANGDGTYRASANTLRDQYGLCEDERFANEPVLGFCSSWLIAPDLVATAGHCITDNICDDVAFVFDFHVGGASEDITRISEDRLYRCTEVVSREYATPGRDYALLRLDRAAVGRRTFELDATVPRTGPRSRSRLSERHLREGRPRGYVVRSEGDRIETRELDRRCP